MVLVADEEVAHHERLEAKTRGGCAALDTRAAAQVAARLLPRHGLVAAQNLVAVENGVDDAEGRLACRRPLNAHLAPHGSQVGMKPGWGPVSIATSRRHLMR